MTVEGEIFSHDGLGLAVGQFMGMFYEDDSLVGLRDPKWLQG